MAKSNNYKVITITTELNGSVGGGAYQFGGIVTKWWDGTMTVGIRGNSAPPKSNNGTERTFNVLLNQGNVVNVLLLQNMGAKTMFPVDFSDFAFSVLNVANNKLTDISNFVLPDTCVGFFANTNELTGDLPVFPLSIKELNLSNNLFEELPDLSYLSLTALQIDNNPITELPNFNKNTITTFGLSGLSNITGTAEFDLSARVSNLNINNILIFGTSLAPAKFNLFKLPATNHTIMAGIRCEFNPDLTDIINLNYLNIPNTSNSSQFLANNCSLNITFPIGLAPRGIKCNTINISNNGMDSANVNATIDNWYSGLNNFNNNIAKVLNIGGTNAAVSGTYQMPTGFVYGVSDGTPASQKEKIWVAENQTVDGSGAGGTKKYKWTVTYN